MIEIIEIYDELYKAKAPLQKYKCSLEIVRYHCKQGEIFQANSTVDTLTRSYAKEASISDKQLESELEKILKTGYENAVPNTISEIEKSLAREGKKNFKYMEHMIKEAMDYAKESRAYSEEGLTNLKNRLQTLREKMLEVKAKTPENETLDWSIINLKDLENDTEGGYYS